MAVEVAVADSTDPNDLEQLERLLRLIRTATNTCHVELVVNGVPVVSSNQQGLIGLNPNRVAHELCGDRGDSDRETADWVGSIAVVPITDPSGESGWLATADPAAGACGYEQLAVLKSSAPLIENILDRRVERDAIEELGASLRTNQITLESARHELSRSNRELEQFAYIASHELLAPVRTVSLYAQILAEASGDVDLGADVVRSCADEISNGLARVSSQVQSLLQLSRLSSDSSIEEVVDLDEVVAAAVHTMAHTFEDVDASVEVGPLPTVAGRAVLLQSVVGNLLSNAVRYRHPDRRLEIKVCATVHDGVASIAFNDNGVGIAAADQERVFELFERAGDHADGSGIGLALSRRILNSVGGSISVESDPSTTGSTFVVEIPTRTDQP